MKRQPPGNGSMSMLFSYSSQSSSVTGSRLIARRTGSGTGAGGGGGGGAGGDSVARATVATVDRRVRLAPQALQVRPPWFTVSHTPHRQMAFTGIAGFPVCPAVSRPVSRTRRRGRPWCPPQTAMPRGGLRCDQPAGNAPRVQRPDARAGLCRQGLGVRCRPAAGPFPAANFRPPGDRS